MVQAIARSKARVTPSADSSWLDHLRARREQGQTLEGICESPWLLGQWLVHRSALDVKSRGVLTEPAPSAPTFVPVRITLWRRGVSIVHLPNGVTVDRAVPAHVEGTAVPRCSTVRAGCHNSSGQRRAS